VSNPSSRLAPGLALIFDMDGVVLDSNPIHRQAWAAFNLRYGLETTEAMHEFMYGKRNDAIIRGFYGEMLPAEEVRQRGAAKEALYRQMMQAKLEDSLVPGVLEFLKEYQDTPKALASNAEPENVDFLLDNSALRDYFQVIVNGHMVENPKPHPEIYLRTSDLLGVAPANCIVFEDSYAGVEAALSAGMRVLGLRTTHYYLPGTLSDIDNFLSGHLRNWLGRQRPVA
jgi:beta-phosphoglucomutase family hydrolase